MFYMHAEDLGVGNGRCFVLEANSVLSGEGFLQESHLGFLLKQGDKGRSLVDRS